MESQIRRKLREWTNDELAPFLRQSLANDGIEASVEVASGMRLAIVIDPL